MSKLNLLSRLYPYFAGTFPQTSQHLDFIHFPAPFLQTPQGTKDTKLISKGFLPPRPLITSSQKLDIKAVLWHNRGSLDSNSKPAV